MKTSLLKGMTAQEQDEMRQVFASAARFRQRLTEVLKEKIETSNKQQRSKSAYETPNWAFLQADSVGYERALFEAISLLSSDSVVDDDPPPAVPTKRKYTRRTLEKLQPEK